MSESEREITWNNAKIYSFNFFELLGRNVQALFFNFVLFNCQVCKQVFSLNFFTRFLLWTLFQVVIFYVNLRILVKVYLYWMVHDQGTHLESVLGMIESIDFLKDNIVVFMYFSFLVYFLLYMTYLYADAMTRMALLRINYSQDVDVDVGELR